MGKAELLGLLHRCWPLHPLVTLLLGRLFQKLAQNERSVFAFLESAEPMGLREFLSRDDRDSSLVYGPDRIYDYLIGSLGEGLYAHWHGKRWAESTPCCRDWLIMPHCEFAWSDHRLVGRHWGTA